MEPLGTIQKWRPWGGSLSLPPPYQTPHRGDRRGSAPPVNEPPGETHTDQAPL